MKKLYEELSVELVKFEAQDVITVSAPNEEVPAETEKEPPNVDAEL
ncbi:MAG: hypothetical protein PUD38_00960 [Firmicutes bacterium]|nr:hypothetical protein [Bacillota bacterium]